jgi:hypothetical protein
MNDSNILPEVRHFRSPSSMTSPIKNINNIEQENHINNKTNSIDNHNYKLSSNKIEDDGLKEVRNFSKNNYFII